MIYKIDWLERKTTSTGKQKADTTLMAIDGTKVADVTIWSDFPNFAELMPGTQLEGDIVTKQNGQYVNRTLYPIRQPGAPRGNANIAKSMERKEKSIEKFQDSKETSILISSSIRDAVQIALEEQKTMGGFGMDSFKERFEHWRGWLIKQHQKEINDYLDPTK